MKRSVFGLVWAALSIALVACVLGGCAAGASSVEAEDAVVPAGPGAVGLFVTRWALRGPAAVERVFDDAALLGVTDVYVQVRGRADAAHLSRFEPRMEHLADFGAQAGSGFDALEVAVAAGRARGMRVHAWVNVLTMWRGVEPPGDSDHLWNAQPSWRLSDGLGRHEPLNERYVMFNPVLTNVHDHLAEVVGEIARYDVSGVVLDWLWLPESRASGDRLWPGDALSVEMYGAETRRGRPGSAKERARYREWVGDRITMLARRLSAAAGARDVSVVVWGGPERSRARLAAADDWAMQGVADRVMCFARSDAEADAWRDVVGAERVERVVMVGRDGDAAAVGGVPAESDVALFAYGSLFESADPMQPRERAGREARRDSISAALANRVPTVEQP